MDGGALQEPATRQLRPAALPSALEQPRALCAPCMSAPAGCGAKCMRLCECGCDPAPCGCEPTPDDVIVTSPHPEGPSVITQTSEDRILTIAIDNERKANSLNAEMLTQLIDAFNAASADQALRAILLTSAGDRGFSAGMDTAQFEHEDSERAYTTITHLGEVCEAVKNCDLPVAAAIHGYCIGGALEIAAAADYRVAATDSWYSMPEVRIGIPSVLDAASLWRIMGWTKATELIMTANRFTAQDMDRCGFLNALVESADVRDTARSYLRDTMESDRAVIAQQKRLFRTWRNTHEQVAIADSRKEFALAFARKAERARRS